MGAWRNLTPGLARPGMNRPRFSTPASPGHSGIAFGLDMFGLGSAFSLLPQNGGHGNGNLWPVFFLIASTNTVRQSVKVSLVPRMMSPVGVRAPECRQAYRYASGSHHSGRICLPCRYQVHVLQTAGRLGDEVRTPGRGRLSEAVLNF